VSYYDTPEEHARRLVGLVDPAGDICPGLANYIVSAMRIYANRVSDESREKENKLRAALIDWQKTHFVCGEDVCQCAWCRDTRNALAT
jgi:hypothetical protein